MLYVSTCVCVEQRGDDLETSLSSSSALDSSPSRRNRNESRLENKKKKRRNQGSYIE